jgi:hypothetical protein
VLDNENIFGRNFFGDRDMEATELFSYNRENFKFNNEMRQKNLYMQQNMRVRQVLLYREDLQDLFGLTIGKMDAYMMVNVLLLGCAAEMYFKGKTPANVPEFIFWFWGVSLGGSFFFLFFSTWLALQASVLSHTYMARCLSQWLRLPIASIEEINAASARLEDYEKNTFLDFVRPPVVVPMGKKMGNNRVGIDISHGKKDLSTHWPEFVEHFELFNSLHNKWQSHEAYARVSMCVGTFFMLSAFSYFTLIYVSIDYGNPWVAGVFVVLTTVAQLVYIRMSLNLSVMEFYMHTVLVIVPPIFVIVAAVLSADNDAITGAVVVPFSAKIVSLVGYAAHSIWIWMFYRQTYHDEDGLPMKFSTVWCLDILGFGMETIRDIEEPRVDFPGFVQPTSSAHVHDRPLNTYNLSQTNGGEQTEGRKKNDEQNGSLPTDIITTCKSLEASLQRLFSYWARNSHQLSPEELEHVEELQVAFNTDSEILKRSVQSHANRLAKEGIQTDSTIDSWVRLTYETDDGGHAPYLINAETGEIMWEAGVPDPLTVEIQRGLSLLPEQLEKYHTNVRKVEYASKREHALGRQKRQKPPTWPWMMFTTGLMTLQLCWIAATVIMIMQVFGFSLPV